MKKILIVEDNPMNMELIMDLLELYGHNITKAEDGIKALERLAEEKFDLILLDIQLPKMDGLEVLDRIKKKLLVLKPPKPVESVPKQV